MLGASPRLRRAFIPKVAACKRWRPRLAHVLLPKFIMVLDGPCTAFLLRHLIALQPLPPGPLPAAHPAPTLQAAPPFLAAAPAATSQAAARRQVLLQAQSRSEFRTLVRAVAAVSAGKLGSWSGASLAGCVLALGRMGIYPGDRFMRAWGEAMGPLLLHFVAQQRGEGGRGGAAAVLPLVTPPAAAAAAAVSRGARAPMKQGWVEGEGPLQRPSPHQGHLLLAQQRRPLLSGGVGWQQLRHIHWPQRGRGRQHMGQGGQTGGGGAQGRVAWMTQLVLAVEVLADWCQQLRSQWQPAREWEACFANYLTTHARGMLAWQLQRLVEDGSVGVGVVRKRGGGAVRELEAAGDRHGQLVAVDIARGEAVWPGSQPSAELAEGCAAELGRAAVWEVMSVRWPQHEAMLRTLMG
ncbi:hypothetical protein V8C86DRAFT_3034329 [Haematococcus lacustris]